jgi:hypothetical protein
VQRWIVDFPCLHAAVAGRRIKYLGSLDTLQERTVLMEQSMSTQQWDLSCQRRAFAQSGTRGLRLHFVAFGIRSLGIAGSNDSLVKLKGCWRSSQFHHDLQLGWGILPVCRLPYQ